jgi:hypothetical protein
LLLTIQVWYNNHQINKTIENTYNQITSLTNVIINDSLALSENGKLTALSDKQKILGRIDTTGITKRVDQIREATKELNECKRYILDANTITYLIQILCFFLIGLQLFISTKNEKKTEKIEKKIKKEEEKIEKNTMHLNRLIQINSLSTRIINYSEMISFYSSQLRNDLSAPEEESVCFSISVRLLEIIEFEEKNLSQKMEIRSYAKSHSISLLHDVVKICKSKKYHEGEGYFTDIYNRLLRAINTIKKIPTNDEFDQFDK